MALSPQDEDRRLGSTPGLGRGREWGVTAERLAELHQRSVEMRRNPTEAEKRLWRILSGSKLNGFKFRRQAVLPPFIVDFLCPRERLIVEVDGDTHDDGADRLRDERLGHRGYRVLRVKNADVISNPDGVWEAIRLALASPLPFRGGVGGGASDLGAAFASTPHPDPSPEGEGL